MRDFRKSISGAMLVLTSLSMLYAQQDPKADTYLQAVSDQFKLDEGYRIEMDYIREDIMRETYAEGNGTIWMRGLKYKIIVDEFEVYFDWNKLYSHNTETEEVYVSIPDPDQPGSMLSPAQMLADHTTVRRRRHRSCIWRVPAS